MQSLKRRQNGITLIALVVTIIVLLILAGVSLNLVAGGNGILRRSTSAVKTYNESAILEKAQLVVAELQMDYYAEDMPTPTFGDYLKEHDRYTTTTGEIFEFEVNDDDTVDIYYYKDKDSEEADMELVLDLKTNEIRIKTNGGEPRPDTEAPVIEVTDVSTSSLTFKITDKGGVAGYQITEVESQPKDSEWEVLDGARVYENIIKSGLEASKSYYIWAIDQVGNVHHITYKTKELEITESTKAVDLIAPSNYGDKVDYRANGVDNWDVFLNDGTNVYIIASDYVPVSNLDLGTGILTEENYMVYGDSREALVGWLQNPDKWSRFTNGLSGYVATGGPNMEQFVKSYNAVFGTSYSDSIEQDGFDLSETADSMWVKATEDKALGYWLASPLANFDEQVWYVSYGGNVYNLAYSSTTFGVRPLIQLPEGVNAKLENGKWIFSNE